MSEVRPPLAPQVPLAGRDRPLATLRAALADVRSGRRAVVLVEGEPGIGKTTLVRRFVADAEATVVWASGDEAEADLDYGLLEQLLRRVPEPWPSDDEMALSGDPLRAGASLVRLVDSLELTPSRPLLVVVDDAHWADQPSLQALAFAARRLRTDPLLVCLVRREDSDRPLPASLHRLVRDEGVHIPLGPLDRRAVEEVAEAVLGEPVTTGSARRLLEHTGGHPLHLRAVLDDLTPAQVRNAVELPVPRSFRSLVLARLAGCSPPAEALVATLAVLGDATPLAVASAIAALADPLAALDEAIDEGLVTEAPGPPTETLLALSHPLVRAAVASDLSHSRRAAIHRRAGEVLPDPSGLRHRLLGTIGPDRDLWAQASSAALAEARRGAHGSAASLYRAALPVACGEPDRSHSLLDAVDQLLLAGRMTDAAALAAEVEGAVDSARRSYTRGRLAYVTGPRREAREHLEAAWRTLQAEPELDETLAGQVAAMLATVHVDRADGAEAEAWCTRALALAPQEAAVASVAHMLAGAHALKGTFEHGLRVLDDLLTQPWCGGPDAGSVARADALMARGLLRLWCHELADAGDDLQAALDLTRNVGSVVARESARFYLAEVRYRQGRWDDAVVLAEQAASIADDSEQAWMAAIPHATVARPLAARGDPAGRLHAERAVAAAATVGGGAGVALAKVAALEAAVSDRNHPEVARLGDELQAAGGAVDERIGPWRLGYVEALVAMGRLDEAEQVAGTMRLRAATPLARSDAAAVAAALAGARADRAAAEAATAAGLGLSAAEVGPFPRARLELAVGRAWRRLGERRRAREALDAARARFEGLGAVPWVHQVEVELTACGLRPSRRPRVAGEALTPQEQAVAGLVARGLTNREVAAELVVSAKTVEHHLSRIYAKLGIRSRTQLAARPPG